MPFSNITEYSCPRNIEYFFKDDFSKIFYKYFFLSEVFFLVIFCGEATLMCFICFGVTYFHLFLIIKI